MAGVRKELRPRLRRLLSRLIERQRRNRLTSAIRYLKEWTGGVPNQNDSVTVPGAAHRLLLSNGNRGTTLHCDLFQPFDCPEGEKATVGRPEGKKRAIGAGYDMCLGRIEGPEPKLTVEPTTSQNCKRQVPSVGRERHCVGDVDGGLRWQWNNEAHSRRRGHRLEKLPPTQASSEHECERSD